MRIFIDESGSFSRNPQGDALSMVGALVIPDQRWSFVKMRYGQIRPALPRENGEVKGRLLEEKHIAAVVLMLHQNNVIFECVGSDLNRDSEEDVLESQTDQADKIVKNLTPTHHPNVHAFAQSLRTRLLALKAPLYVQSVLMWELIALTLQNATIYHCQRGAKELGAFHWVVDAKGDRTLSEWESWWTEIVMPILQGRSVNQPLGMIDWGDYSYFRRFDGERPVWFPIQALLEDVAAPPVANIRQILMEDFRFASGAEPGLELVDIVVNATRRALRGNLQASGFAGIPGIMIHRSIPYVRMVRLGGSEERTLVGAGSLTARVLNTHFSNGGRSMTAPGTFPRQ